MKNSTLFTTLLLSFLSSIAMSQNGTKPNLNLKPLPKVNRSAVVIKDVKLPKIDVQKPSEGPLGKKLGLDNKMGPGSGGGGDPYTLDFLKTIESEVIPWLERNGHTLPTPVSAIEFKNYVNPQRIAVLPDVYESCDGSTDGRNVVGCYNAQEKIWLISRNFYPLDVVDSPMKRNFIMHEIFRAMGIEGDDYKITKAASHFQVVSDEMIACVVNMRKERYNGGAQFSSTDAIDYCRKVGAAKEAQICAVTLRIEKYHKISGISGASFSSENTIKSCIRSSADLKFIECASLLRADRHNNGAELSENGAIKACERSGSDQKYQSCIVKYRQPLHYGGADMSEDDAISGCRARD